MRYLLLTYLKQPNGQINEVMSLARNLKKRDYQTANVILDFKHLKVVTASMDGVNVPRDFDRIVQYYMRYYESTITRLFKENGYEVTLEKVNDPKVQP